MRAWLPRRCAALCTVLVACGGHPPGSGLLRCTRPDVLRAYREAGWIDASPPRTGAPLPVPGVLVGGRHSEVVGAANLEGSADAWGVPLVWMENSGHFPYVEEPGAFTGLAVAWINHWTR